MNKLPFSLHVLPNASHTMKLAKQLIKFKQIKKKKTIQKPIQDIQPKGNAYITLPKTYLLACYAPIDVV